MDGEKIINELFKEFSYCGHCGSYECKDHSYRKLPDYIETMKLLKLLENYKEEVK